jgi:hypothetical protein
LGLISTETVNEHDRFNFEAVISSITLTDGAAGAFFVPVAQTRDARALCEKRGTRASG